MSNSPQTLNPSDIPVLDPKDLQDVNTDTAGQSEQSKGIGYYFRKVWNDWGDTQLLPNLAAQVQQDKVNHQELVRKDFETGHPVQAWITGVYNGTLDDLASLALQFSTPKQVASQVLLGGANNYVRNIRMMANSWFAFSGLKEALTSQQGESLPDSIQRRGLAAASGLLSTAGIASDASEIVRNAVQNKLGLKGNLASKVQEKALQAEQIRTESEAQAQSAQQIGQGISQSIKQTELPAQMQSIVDQAQASVTAEKGRIDGIWENDVMPKAEDAGPVASSAELRSRIANNFVDAGLQPTDVPASATKVLPKETIANRVPTASEIRGSLFAATLVEQNMPAPEIRSALLNLSYAPGEVDVIMGISGIPETDQLGFRQMKNLRNDLWNASENSYGPRQWALKQSYGQVTTMMNQFAEDNGFGKEYQGAKTASDTFYKNLGVGAMRNFIDTSDVVKQAMEPRVAALLSDTSAKGSALRELLSKAGVDITPIEKLVEEQKSVPKQTASTVKQIRAEAQARIDQVGETNPIIPKTSDLELQGLSNDQIKLNAVRAFAASAQKSGIGNYFAYMQIMYGAALLSYGSPFGLLHLVRGGASIAPGWLTGSPSFQDWVIRESGVAPGTPAASRMRAAIASSGPLLQKIATSTTAERALLKQSLDQKQQTEQQVQKQRFADQQKMFSPSSAPANNTAASRPSGNIRIAP